ncbi:MAG: lyase family protein [Pseudomonadota bacterium]
MTPMSSALDGALWSTPSIAACFSDAARLDAMVRVEVALALAEAEVGLIPAEAAARIAERLPQLVPFPAALADGTAAAGVVVPPLVQALRAALGPDGDWLHYGATTQDIMDTALVLQLRDALALVSADLEAVIAALGTLARNHAATPMAARTRGQVATPTTLGLRAAGWRGPLVRARRRLPAVLDDVLLVQLGGASGTLAAYGGHGGPLTAALAQRLSLAAPAKPWHTERDGLATLASWCATVAAACGRIGADLALLARSEIAEIALPGGGSSTMPHKVNPTRAEALVALGRHAAHLVGPMHEAVMHTEERDIGAWAQEWIALPPLVDAAATALRHAGALVEQLKPRPARMAATLGLAGGAPLAEAMAFALAPAIGLTAAQAVVKCALAARREDETLVEALRRMAADTLDPGIDWAAFADPASHVGEAERLVAAALAADTPDHPTRSPQGRRPTKTEETR